MKIDPKIPDSILYDRCVPYINPSLSKQEVRKRSINLSSEALRRLRPGTWLNDEGINQFAKLISIFSEPSVMGDMAAILDTHMLSGLDTVPDDHLFTRISRTDMLDKDLWILPLHSHFPTHHWTLVVVFFQKRTIYHFDSFGDKTQWHDDSEV